MAQNLFYCSSPEGFHKGNALTKILVLVGANKKMGRIFVSLFFMLPRKIFLFIIISLVFFSCKKENTLSPGSLPNTYSDQPLGAAARDMVTADQYISINIQVQYMPGYALDSATLTNVRTYLSSLCNKPAGITISQTQIAANNDTQKCDNYCNT